MMWDRVNVPVDDAATSTKFYFLKKLWDIFELFRRKVRGVVKTALFFLAFFTRDFTIKLIKKQKPHFFYFGHFIFSISKM